MKDMSLTQNLLAKFCHDLAGSITALSGGVEFLQDTNPTTRRKARELIDSSVHQTISRLEFFRVAYGIQKHDGEANLEEIRALSSALLSNSKVILDFHAHPSHQPEIFICDNTGKLILCMIYIAYTVLLYGGVITVNIEKTRDGKRVAITASGKRVKNDLAKNRILRGDIDNLTLSPSNVHYYYVFLIIRELGSEIVINLAEEEIQYIIE